MDLLSEHNLIDRKGEKSRHKIGNGPKGVGLRVPIFLPRRLCLHPVLKLLPRRVVLFPHAGDNWMQIEETGKSRKKEVRLTIKSVGEHFYCLIRKRDPGNSALRVQATFWASS